MTEKNGEETVKTDGLPADLLIALRSWVLRMALEPWTNWSFSLAVRLFRSAQTV
jgi:hypothetical protein